jgi:hypothetical protein
MVHQVKNQKRKREPQKKNSMSPPAPVENNKQQQQTSSSVVVAAPSLNLYKKIAVIRKPNDSLTYEDVEGNVKTVSVEQLGDAIATAVRLFFRHIVRKI